MTSNLKLLLEELEKLIAGWNTKEIASEQEFVDRLKKLSKGLASELEKPQGVQQQIG